MSVNKLGIILFSGFLLFAMAPVAPAQSTNQETTKKQTTTTQKGTTTKDTGKTTTSDTKSTEKSATSETTEKSTTAKKSGKKTSAVSNDKVRQAQMSLKREGFDPGPIDGIMGVMTMTALRNYQSHNGLEVTGTLTAETEKSLSGNATASTSQNRSSNLSNSQDQRFNSSRNQTQPAQDQSQHQSQATVSSMDETKRIQQALSDMGYTPGDINGMMSSDTQQAIRNFQWYNNLPVTGNIDEQTKIAINTQSQGGFENAQLSKTYSSTTSSDLEREKPATTTEEKTYSSDVERTKPGITTEAQTQTRTETKDKSYDTSHDATVHHENDKYSSDAKQDKHDKKDHSGKVDKDLANRASKAAAVLQDLTATADKRIPNELLERAEAIAVIPNMIKGAFGIGGRFGKGVVSQRADNGRWSTPSFIEVGGGSFGAQLGVTSTDLVLVFTDRKALSLLEGGKDLKLGVDAGVAAGPIGRSAEAGVNAKLDTAIYAYSRSKGLFAGVALDGAVLSIDKDANEKVYGASLNAEEILNGKAAMNSTVRPFMDALAKTVPSKRISQK